MNVAIEARLLPLKEGGWMSALVTETHGAKKVMSWSGPAGLWRPPIPNSTEANVAVGKWGIYRSRRPNVTSYLDDTQIYFADFCVEKVVKKSLSPRAVFLSHFT